MMLTRQQLTDAASDLNKVLDLSPVIDIREPVEAIRAKLRQASELLRDSDNLKPETRQVINSILHPDEVAAPPAPPPAPAPAPVQVTPAAVASPPPEAPPAPLEAVPPATIPETVTAAPEPAAPGPAVVASNAPGMGAEPVTATPAVFPPSGEATPASARRTTKPKVVGGTDTALKPVKTAKQVKTAKPAKAPKAAAKASKTAPPPAPARAKRKAPPAESFRYEGSHAALMDNILEAGGSWSDMASQAGVNPGIIRAHARYRHKIGKWRLEDQGESAKMYRVVQEAQAQSA